MQKGKKIKLKRVRREYKYSFWTVPVYRPLVREKKKARKILCGSMKATE